VTDDAFALPPRVDFDNLMEVREAGERHIDAGDERVFDLSGLEFSNSVVVALLLAWFRYAHVHGKVVTFVGVPTELMNIIEVSDLEGLLPVR
jgi:ABC-type transporter Mla MlaB component